MSCEPFEGGFICGNFAEVLSEKPQDFDYETNAKWLEPWPKEWDERITVGKTTCNCKQIETHYAPWYGFTWYHSTNCALLRRVQERPQLRNLWCFENIETIGYSE